MWWVNVELEFGYFSCVKQLQLYGAECRCQLVASADVNWLLGLQKKKHHQLRKVLCGRCRLLSHGHMITAVGGNGGYSGGKQFVSAEELREKLSHLRHENALIVKLVRLSIQAFRTR